MRKAYSVFKQSVHNVSAHQLQQHTIKICCKMIQVLCHLYIIRHMIIHWHVHMGHLLLGYLYIESQFSYLFI